MKSEYLLKVILKKSKPINWFQMTVPSGITFSALSLLLDIATDQPAGDFEFEVIDKGVRLRENIFEDSSRKTWQFSLREADTTFIDDYFAEAIWLTYRPDVSSGIAYRVELLRKAPGERGKSAIVKLSNGASIAYGDDEQRFTRQMKQLLSYKAAYDKAFSFLKKSEMPYAAGETWDELNLLPAMAKPVSKSDNMIQSASVSLQKTADLMKVVGIMSEFKTEKGQSFREALYYTYGLNDLIWLSKSIGAKPKKLGQGLNLSNLDEDLKERVNRMARAWGSADRLLRPEVMEERLMTVNDQQIEVFERAIKAGGKLQAASFDDADAMARFCELDYAFSIEAKDAGDKDTVIIPDDVIATYQSINTPDFQARRKQHVWLLECLDIVEYYYGVIPVSPFYRLYKQFGELSQAEMVQTIENLDSYDTDCVVHDGRIVFRGWLHDDEYKKLESYLSDKPYYIPDKNEVEDLARNAYPSQQPEVREMRSLLKKTFSLEDIDAEDLTEEIWYAFNQGETIHDVMDIFEKKDLVFPSEKALRTFVNKIMALNNSVHMLYNRGFTPLGLRAQTKSRVSREGLTIVPESTKAADMLRQSKDQLRKMGVKLDLNAGADEIDQVMISPDRKTVVTAKKKIYPNDPCPCGSGKKYKKCCGLKK